jgi:hypothetical protein
MFLLRDIVRESWTFLRIIRNKIINSYRSSIYIKISVELKKIPFLSRIYLKSIISVTIGMGLQNFFLNPLL